MQKVKTPSSPLFFNRSPVAKADEQKHLGLILCPNLCFQKHIRDKLAKAMKLIGVIKHLARYLPLKTLDQMYKSFVRPHLDYCDIIFHAPHKVSQLGLSLSTTMEEIEKVQYKAALAVTGAWQGSNRSKIFEELGWESLSDRRMSRRILMMHKIVNNQTPDYLTAKLLPMARAPIANPLSLREYRCRTGRFMSSFFPDAARSWNVIMSHFSTMPTLNTLKSHLISLFRPSGKSTFKIHDPPGLKCLFQLRLGLSHLRSHKNSHNFEDTPSSLCLCETGIEDTNHYIFTCPFYAVHRATLAANVIGILIRNNLNQLGNTVSVYLYGHHSLSDIDNRSIILATLEFLKNTNRFTQEP